jgi:SAM-dependent methyltransferase
LYVSDIKWYKMQFLPEVIKAIPAPIRKAFRPAVLPIIRIFSDKYNAELSFWKSRLEIDGGKFKNSHYERIMLAMAGEPDDSFLKGKVVADFGCGPRGSLVWAKAASLRIGIDVLADRYADIFSDNILSHGMIYLKSTEKVIPLPPECVDVIFTLNAMDHVYFFPEICREIIRILKPGGSFIGSFNIGGRATTTEPQALTESLVLEHLLKYLDIRSYRLTRWGPIENLYGPFLDGDFSYTPGEKGLLWVKGLKPKVIV